MKNELVLVLNSNVCVSVSINSNTFKGLRLVQSHFWNTVLKTSIDNNCIAVNNSPLCTLLWENENVKYAGQVLHIKDWIKGNIMFVN